MDLYEPWFSRMYDDLQQAAKNFCEQHPDWGNFKAGISYENFTHRIFA